MKKGKVFGKRHVVLAVLVVCLGAAVWLNMRYSSFSKDPADNTSKNLGDTQFLENSGNLGEAVEASAGVDYIVSARNERNLKRETAVDDLRKTANDSSVSDEVKKQALDSATKIASDIDKEAAIETVIKAKGFDDALAVISDSAVTVIVPSDNLLTSQTIQIQDAVTSQTGINLENIKIIPVK